MQKAWVQSGQAGNNATPLSDNRSARSLWILNFAAPHRTLLVMKTLALITLLALAAPVGAQAACYVEYKAKQDSPLRLHYGVLLIDGGGCPGPSRAMRIASQRLASGGWTLLNVLGLDDRPPSQQQKANAGAYYLRY